MCFCNVFFEEHLFAKALFIFLIYVGGEFHSRDEAVVKSASPKSYIVKAYIMLIRPSCAK